MEMERSPCIFVLQAETKHLSEDMWGNLISSSWGAPVSSEWSLPSSAQMPTATTSLSTSWMVTLGTIIQYIFLAGSYLNSQCLSEEGATQFTDTKTKVPHWRLQNNWNVYPPFSRVLILSQWRKRKASKHLPCCEVPENIGGARDRYRAGSSDSDIVKPGSDLTFIFPILSHEHHAVLVAGVEGHTSPLSGRERIGLCGWSLPPSAYSASSPHEQGAAGLSELEPQQINSMNMWRRH